MKQGGGQWMSNTEALGAMDAAVSRISKKIASIYLANSEFKSANMPRVYVVLPPPKLT